MSSWAKVGVSCVLVDDSPGWVRTYGGAKAGDICEILELDVIDGIEAVRCRELTGKWVHAPDEFALLSRYRPLTTKTLDQDVQMFLSLLEPAGVDA